MPLLQCIVEVSGRYHFGRLEDLLTASARLMCLLPKPVDVRTVVAAVAKALAMALYITRRIGDRRVTLSPIRSEDDGRRDHTHTNGGWG